MLHVMDFTCYLTMTILAILTYQYMLIFLLYFTCKGKFECEYSGDGCTYASTVHKDISVRQKHVSSLDAS